jgi:ribonuclease T2
MDDTFIVARTGAACDKMQPMVRRTLISAVVLVSLLAGAAGAQRAKKNRTKKSLTQPGFSYYLLTLTWAPNFCAVPTNPQDPAECGIGKKLGFVVHGLWPQGQNRRAPDNCGPAGTVAYDIVTVMLKYIPTERLIQHEWKTHGTCSGLSVADYFAAVRKTRDSVVIPDQFKAPARTLKLSPAAIEAAFAAANPTFPKTAFRTSCTNNELQEARLCFDKNLSPRACTDSAGECALKTIAVRPVR